MAKLQNIFAKGIVNKDVDGRFVDSSELIDAENFFVNTVDGESGGIGKNALGNILKTNYGILGKTVGVGFDGPNNKVYNCIKGPDYDYIIEYDINTYITEIVAQSTTGTRLNFREGERVLNVDVIVTGNRYDAVTQQGGNLLAISGDSNPPRIFNINRSKTWGVDGFRSEEIMLIKAPPLNPLIVVPFTTSDENSQIENYLKDKFVSFTYRYKYKDGYYSAIATWEEYSFDSSPFKFNFVTMENDGMINIYNACNLSFNSGPREVVAIDLLFKKSNENVVYKIDQFVKKDEGWSDNITIPTPIRFTNSKVYSILPKSEYFRSFDNVPENETAAAIAGNRKISANYREGKDLIDKNGDKVVMDYTLGVTSVANEEEEIPLSKLDKNPQTVTPTPTVPFTTSLVEDGKVRIDFSGYNLVENSAISIFFNLETTQTEPVIVRTTTKFISNYFFILTQDYATIEELVNDTANGFKTNIETGGYFSNLAKNKIILPTDSLPFTTSYFHGFIVTVVSPNVIDISLPIMKYEIEVLPSGPNTYLEEFYYDKSTQVILNSVGSKKSMKSYRSYEVAMIYRDLQGRKTTALTSELSTIFIPISNSINKNILTVNIPTTQKPPSWATSYKFAIKQNKGFYNTIYCTTFYVDGQFVWIKLQGSSINKVKEGDTLLVKRDIENDYIAIPVTTKVLEVKLKEKDFITGNVDKYGQAISEESGLYMKIKPEGFQIKYIGDEFTNYTFDEKSHDVPSVTITIPTTTPTSLPAGSVVTFSIHSTYRSDREVNDYNQPFIASADYANFGEFYDAQLASVAFQGNNTSVRDGGVFIKSATTNSITLRGTSAGTGRYNAFLNGKISIRSLSGIVIFESIPDDVDDGIFYETPDLFDIVDGEHVFNGPNVVSGVHSLAKTFNCFVQGNGAESNQILDAFNKPYIDIDFCPTAVSEDEYKQVNRFADITYSGVYNANTNVNKLNEFNLYLANFKEDIDKSYGAIYKIRGEETNLQVFQEAKDSQVFFGKDFLYNADGSTNLSQTSEVLAKGQDLYVGDFGISTHSDSYDSYGNNAYHTDVDRGVVVKKANNGLFEISSQGMRNYFKTLFRDNVINHINGKYDQFNDVYVLNIKMNNNPNDYVTWVYSDKDNGWLGKISFNPEDMCCVNGKFLSFYQGQIYEHNQQTGRNTFYGKEYPSSFKFNFSQMPSERKTYKTVEIEGTDAWKMALETDQDKGYINVSDFEKQEGVFRAYPRVSNTVIDTSLLSCQGIGNCTVNGLVLSFPFNLESSLSVGDQIRNSTLQLVGTITSKTKNSLTLNAVANVVTGDFVLASKPQSIENQGLLGYHMVVTATLSKNTKTEVYAVNSEVIKSYT